jgi:diguanylate cyclase (GGDEF)-like protein
MQRRILLVEDNADAALALMSALALPADRYRYEVIHVTDLAHAVAEVERGGIDAAIVDLGLPDSRGIEAPQVISRVASDLPIVVLTGHKSEEDALALIKMGIQDYLLKGHADVAQVRRALGFAIERKRVEEELRREAWHDPLTGVLNRRSLLEQLQKSLSHADRGNNRAAILIIDLDDFKAVNDSLGHAVGDTVLREVAIRTRTSLRAGDSVGRLGGDEFCVILEPLAEASNALDVAIKLARVLNTSINIGRQVITIGASIGVAVYPDDARAEKPLLELADAAMYRAKRTQSRVCLSDPCQRATRFDAPAQAPSLRAAAEPKKSQSS